MTEGQPSGDGVPPGDVPGGDAAPADASSAPSGWDAARAGDGSPEASVIPPGQPGAPVQPVPGGWQMPHHGQAAAPGTPQYQQYPVAPQQQWYAPPPPPAGPAVPPGAVPGPYVPTYYQPGPTVDSLAIVSLVLALLTFGCGITFIPAIICGHISLSRIKKQPQRYSGRGMALAGTIIGYVLGVLMIVLVVGVLAFAGAHGCFGDNPPADC